MTNTIATVCDIWQHGNGTAVITTVSPAGAHYLVEMAEDEHGCGKRVLRRNTQNPEIWKEVPGTRDEDFGMSQLEAVGRLIDELTAVASGTYDAIDDTKLLTGAALLDKHPENAGC